MDFPDLLAPQINNFEFPDCSDLSHQTFQFESRNRRATHCFPAPELPAERFCQARNRRCEAFLAQGHRQSNGQCRSVRNGVPSEQAGYELFQSAAG